MTVHQPRVFGAATSYANLRKLIAARRQELGLSQLAVDEIAGVQTGYTGKIECGARHFGDMSFGAILGALGIRLDVVVVAGKLSESIDASNASVQARAQVRKNLSAKGGRARAEKLSPEKRRAIARLGGKSRWRDWRARQAEMRRKARKADAANAV